MDVHGPHVTTPRQTQRTVCLAAKSGGWTNATQAAKLTASDGAADDFLGVSVGVAGNTIVADAPYDLVGANSHEGAVYVFVEPAGGWANGTQTAKLTSSDGAANDEFGYSVAVSGATIVAGAPSAALAGNNYRVRRTCSARCRPRSRCWPGSLRRRVRRRGVRR